MSNKYIEQLINGICKPSPERALLNSILDKERSELTNAILNKEELDSIKINEAINEIIKLLYKNDFVTVRKYSNYISLGKDEMEELTMIAFDIAKYKDEIENMFCLCTQYSLNSERVNEAVLPKIFNLIQEDNIDEALSVKKKYENTLLKDMLEKYGEKYFKKAMTFDVTQTDRNYKNAFEVKKIFKLDDKTIAQLADTQFEYNMMTKDFLQAAEIANKFKLPLKKLRKAEKKGKSNHSAIKRIQGEIDEQLSALNIQDSGYMSILIANESIEQDQIIESEQAPPGLTELLRLAYKTENNGDVNGIGEDGLTSIVAGASDIVITFDLLNILEGDIVLAIEGLSV